MSEIHRPTRLVGFEAIEYVESLLDAESEGDPPGLSKYGDPVDPEKRHGLTPDEAREIAREDPGLIYYERKGS